MCLLLAGGGSNVYTLFFPPCSTPFLGVSVLPALPLFLFLFSLQRCAGGGSAFTLSILYESQSFVVQILLFRCRVVVWSLPRLLP